MKRLNKFSEFNMTKFLEEKDLVFIGGEEYSNFDTKEFEGMKYQILIKKDDSLYAIKADGGEIRGVNAREMLTVKIKGQKELHNFEMFTPVRLTNATASIYGEHQNNLSVFCEEIQLVSENNPVIKKAISKEVI